MPEKTESPTIIDPYTMLALAVAFQRFQPIAPNRAKVNQSSRGIEPAESLPRLVFDGSKPPARITFVNRAGLFATEGMNHLRQSYHVQHSMSFVLPQ
jgi:hypothetical protein